MVYLGKALFKVTVAVVPSIRLTLNKCLNTTHAISGSTEFEGLLGIVDQNPDVLSLTTLQFLYNHPSGEGDDTRSEPGAAWVGGSCVLRGGLFEETHSGEDGDHLVIVREVGIDGAVEGEGRRVGIKSVVGLGAVNNGRSGKTSDELVDIAYTLHATQFLSVSSQRRELGKLIRNMNCGSPGAVELVKVAAILIPFVVFFRKECTKWALLLET